MEQLDTDAVPYKNLSSPFSQTLHDVFYRAAARVQISSVTKVLLRILLILLVALLIAWVLLGIFPSSRQPTAQPLPAMMMPPLSIAVHLHAANETSDIHEATTTAKPATAANVLIAFGGAHHRNASYSLTIQNLDDGGRLLQTLATPDSGLLHFGYTLHHNNKSGKLYVLDGWSETGSVSQQNTQKLYSFDLKTRTWDSDFPRIPARSAGAVVLLSPYGDDDDDDHNLYAVGRSNNDGNLIMFSYNVKQNLMWVNRQDNGASQPDFMTDDICCGVTMNGIMYFLLNSGKMTLFDEYDNERQWKELSSLASRCDSPACVALPSQHKIIVAGGRLANGTTVDSLQVYDTIADTWTLSTTLKLSRARDSLRSVVVRNSRGVEEDVLFCGGYTDDLQVLDICERLDWTNQRINATFSMAMGRTLFGLVVATMAFA